MKKYKNILAVVAMLGIGAGFALSSWVTVSGMEVATPTAMKVLKSGRLLVATVTDLLIVGKEGALLSSNQISSLGVIDERVVDIDETTGGELLLATTGDNTIYKCSVDLGACSSFIKPEINPFDPNAATVLIATDLNRGFIYLSNSSRQQIEQYDMAGKFIQDLSLDSRGLLYPNDMWILDDGRVVVTDTIHQRIITLDPIGEHEVMSFETRGNPISVVVTPEGKRWTIEWQGGLLDTNIEQYTEDGTYIKRVNLKHSDDPIRLDIMTDYGLLALTQETSRIAILGVLDGFPRGSLEGQGLTEYFNSVLLEKETLNNYLQFAYIILGLSALLVVFVIGLEYGGKNKIVERAFGANVNKPAPSTQSVHWVAYSKSGRYKTKILGILLGLGLVYLSLILYDKAPLVLFLLVSMFIFHSYSVVRISKAVGKARLGIAGDFVFVDDGFDGVGKAHCSEVVFGVQAIVVGGAAVFYVNPILKENVFENEEVQRLLETLDDRNGVSIFEMNKLLKKIKHPVMGLMLQIGMLYILGILLTFLLFSNIS